MLAELPTTILDWVVDICEIDIREFHASHRNDSSVRVGLWLQLSIYDDFFLFYVPTNEKLSILYILLYDKRHIFFIQAEQKRTPYDMRDFLCI